jgi:hypothetical protein
VEWDDDDESCTRDWWRVGIAEGFVLREIIDSPQNLILYLIAITK